MDCTYPAVWGRHVEQDGSYVTTWSIELRGASQLRQRALEAVAGSCDDLDEGFRVRLQSLGNRCVEAVVTTRRPGTRPEYGPLTQGLFRSIDHCLGGIARIEGLPRAAFGLR